MVHPLDVVMKAHNKDYVRWLKDHLSRRSMDDIYGYTIYTKERDKKTSYQNRSILIECITVDEADKRVYYGTIEEIWELNYVKVKVPLFRCKWVPLS